MRNAIALLPLVLISGCNGCMGDIYAASPAERGLSYVASAIVIAAAIRALFNR